MEKNLGVRVVYRNGQMEPVYAKEYTLKDYCDMLREDQLRLITDVEEMGYQANGGKRKEDWSDNTWAAFCKVKHKILDKAGDISRLPENLIENVTKEEEAPKEDDATLSSFVAKVFKRM